MYNHTGFRDGRCERAFSYADGMVRYCPYKAYHTIGTSRFCSTHKQEFLAALCTQINEDASLAAWACANPNQASKQEAATIGAQFRSELAGVADRLEKPRDYIYFMEREGLVKIGVSRNVEKRVREVSRGSAMPEGMTVGPVHLIGKIPGSYTEERALHRRFWKERVHGEWFRKSEPLMAHIEALLA